MVPKKKAVLAFVQTSHAWTFVRHWDNHLYEITICWKLWKSSKYERLYNTRTA